MDIVERIRKYLDGTLMSKSKFLLNDAITEIESLRQQLAKPAVEADALRDMANQLLVKISWDDEEGFLEHSEYVANLREAIAAYDASR